jgi:hypothetical protein
VSVRYGIRYRCRRSECYFWDMFEICTPAQIAVFWNETAIAKDYIMVGYTNADGTKVLY